MILPGRLRRTTLRAVLAEAHAAKASGTLGLEEDHGRTHRVHLRDGLVTAVEYDGLSPPLAELLRAAGAIDGETHRRGLLRSLASNRLLGEVLVQDFHIARSSVGEALERQIGLRLRALAALSDARLSFRVAVRTPSWARGDAAVASEDALGDEPPRPPDETLRERAAPKDACDPYLLLGVSPRSDERAIRAAYKKLARVLHPDAHPFADDDERRRLAVRFADATRAYVSLVA